MRPLYAALGEAMTERRPTSAEGHYPPADCWFEMRAYPSPEGLSVFLRDFTERKRTHMELQAALDAAQAADQATRQFLTMMSHELRTPMQAIIGYAEFLLAGPKRSLTPEQVEDVQTIRARSEPPCRARQADARHLATRCGSARAQGRTGLAGLNHRGGTPGRRTPGRGQGLTFSIDLPADLPPVLGDEMGVHQILLNLVGNAVKFTEQGEVRISARAIARTRSPSRCAIPGSELPPETLPHIFEEFHQADRGMTRRYEGAGLGLTIASRLAERMGGRLSAESQPGVGIHLHAAPAGRPAANLDTHGKHCATFDDT